jgi:hypothetical protein
LQQGAGAGFGHDVVVSEWSVGEGAQRRAEWERERESEGGGSGWQRPNQTCFDYLSKHTPQHPRRQSRLHSFSLLSFVRTPQSSHGMVRTCWVKTRLVARSRSHSPRTAPARQWSPPWQAASRRASRGWSRATGRGSRAWTGGVRTPSHCTRPSCKPQHSLALPPHCWVSSECQQRQFPREQLSFQRAASSLK